MPAPLTRTASTSVVVVLSKNVMVVPGATVELASVAVATMGPL